MKTRKGAGSLKPRLIKILSMHLPPAPMPQPPGMGMPAPMPQEAAPAAPQGDPMIEAIVQRALASAQPQGAPVGPEMPPDGQ